MVSLKNLKRHIRNIRVFRAYSGLELAKQALLFPLDYYFRDGRSCYPLNIAFFVTLRCNARCSMCNLSEILNEKEKNEPSVSDIEKFLSGIENIKPSIILFGGEPFVRKDLVEIVSAIKRRGLSCGIFTNGTMLNEGIVNALSGLKLDFIAFSVQGVGNTHDDIVGVKGAYNSLMRNLDLFLKNRRQTRVVMHIMITEKNLEELNELARLGKDKHVDLVRFGHPTFFTGSDIERNQNVLNNIFPGENIKEMSYLYDPAGQGNTYYSAIKQLKEKFGKTIAFIPDLSLQEIRSWYSDRFKINAKCLFIWRGLFIYPNGDVYPCESLRYPLGNIYKEGFMDIWNSSKYVRLRRQLRKGLLPACARCCKL